ncbi:hypothetical protein [Marispirochaeta aestuarii]|uniref:hypothetical protein n=1 Tax=Marispirochaeta aestuarii TaxID=1963862 RepID=UPI0029C85692|nr:hypothetical protein [Marispirochaeta aestuarii]
MKRVTLLLFVVITVSLPIFSQSNEIIDQILLEERLSAGSAAYLLTVLEGDASYGSREEAFGALRSEAVFEFLGLAAPDAEVNLGQFAHLVQRKLDLPRGLGSTLFPGPRYSLRDLKFLQMVQGRGAPDSPVSGERALRIIGRALSELEERS